MRHLLLTGLAGTMLIGAAPGQSPRAVHDGVVVLDTHFDTPANLGRPGWSIMDRHAQVTDGDQVDYPRMVDGGVDGGFFAVYTAQGPRTEAGDRAARDFAIVRAGQIREMIAAHPQAFELATTAGDAVRIAAANKRFVFLSMENGYPFEADLTLMKTFRAIGVTMMGATHFRNNDLADSATDKPEWNGLSPQGKRFVAEANRLGIVIDGSHSSDAATEQMAALSKAPVILSHSGMYGVYPHPRNVSDATARAIAAKGGVIQINAFSAYMIDQPKNPERDAALTALVKDFGRMDAMTVAEKRALVARRKAVEARFPAPRATFDDFMKHMFYAIRLVGIDHVGVSGDFDGGGGVAGLDDVTAYPKITAALLKAGYGRADVEKVWGGNALRVLAAAQALADPDAVPKIVAVSR